MGWDVPRGSDKSHTVLIKYSSGSDIEAGKKEIYLRAIYNPYFVRVVLV
jgi:hypothetical protein